MTGSRRILRATVLAFALLALAVALLPVVAAAGATKPLPMWQQIVNDWRADGSIDGSYSIKDLRSVRDHVSSDELQYSTLGTQLDEATARAERQQKSSGSSTWWLWLVGAAVVVLLVAGAVVWRIRGPRAGDAANQSTDLEEP